MASILDAGLVSVFTSIFLFLLVYALVYGVLSWRQFFGESRGLYAIISFVIAIVAAISPPIKHFIVFVTPWYVALFVVIFFILLITSMFGHIDFVDIVSQPRVYSWIVIFSVLIFFLGLGFVFGPLLTPGGQASPQPSAIDHSAQVIGSSDDFQYAQPGQLATAQAGGSGQGGTPAPGQKGSTATSDFGINLMNTIFHPKILGLIATILIAALTVFFLSMPQS